MKIITIMDYNTEPEITMCKGWFYFVRKFHPNDEIIVYHSGNISDELIRDDVTYKLLDTSGVPQILSKGKVNKLAVHKEWGNYDEFIFMDADAYPLTNLQHLLDRCTNPITICGHEPGQGGGWKQLNSGVIVQKEPFFNYTNLIDTYYKYNKQLKYSGSDQALCQMYFEDIGYQWWDDNIMGMEYNSADKADITIDENDNVVAISKITDKKILVLHGWYKYKFWMNTDTKELWEFINNKVNNE